jgi:N-formylglutamate deformylase
VVLGVARASAKAREGRFEPEVIGYDSVMSVDPEPLFSLTRGHRPLLVSVPHAGRYLPPEVRANLAGDSVDLADTDHFVDRLYAFAEDIGVSIIVAHWSRWYIDLNRPPDNRPLYPGQAGTGLVPTDRFDGTPLWKTGAVPDATELDHRRERGWAPYHRALQAELDRLKSLFGHAVLWDAHSIRSRVPLLFDGTLPDLNLGTNSGASCAPDLRARVARRLDALPQWTSVVDGRFRGGHITRHYGRPDHHVHALQLELAQSTYMDEDARVPVYDADRASALRADLTALLDEVAAWRP